MNLAGLLVRFGKFVVLSLMFICLLIYFGIWYLRTFDCMFVVCTLFVCLICVVTDI